MHYKKHSDTYYIKLVLQNDNSDLINVDNAKHHLIKNVVGI